VLAYVFRDGVAPIAWTFGAPDTRIQFHPDLNGATITLTSAGLALNTGQSVEIDASTLARGLTGGQPRDGDDHLYRSRAFHGSCPTPEEFLSRAGGVAAVVTDSAEEE